MLGASLADACSSRKDPHRIMAACPHCQRQRRRARIGAWWGWLGVIAAAVVGVFAVWSYEVQRHDFRLLQIELTRMQVTSTERAVLRYSRFHGLPTQRQGLDPLAQAQSDGLPYLAELPRDAWQRPLVYVAPGNKPEQNCHFDTGGHPFLIYSTGPDGLAGTADDVGVRARRTRS